MRNKYFANASDPMASDAEPLGWAFGVTITWQTTSSVDTCELVRLAAQCLHYVVYIQSKQSWHSSCCGVHNIDLYLTIYKTIMLCVSQQMMYFAMCRKANVLCIAINVQLQVSADQIS